MSDFTKEEQDHILKTLDEAKAREVEFFKRYGFSHEEANSKQGQASEAHMAWVKVCENEYKKVADSPSRLSCDSPMARKMFVLGYLIAKNLYNNEHGTL